MIPFQYFTDKEKQTYKAIKKNLRKCSSFEEVEKLENKLDLLLEKAIIRYRKKKGIG